jgi:hypothetical protein
LFLQKWRQELTLYGDLWHIKCLFFGLRKLTPLHVAQLIHSGELEFSMFCLAAASWNEIRSVRADFINPSRVKTSGHITLLNKQIWICWNTSILYVRFCFSYYSELNRLWERNARGQIWTLYKHTEWTFTNKRFIFYARVIKLYGFFCFFEGTCIQIIHISVHYGPIWVTCVMWRDLVTKFTELAGKITYLLK